MYLIFLRRPWWWSRSVHFLQKAPQNTGMEISNFPLKHHFYKSSNWSCEAAFVSWEHSLLQESVLEHLIATLLYYEAVMTRSPAAALWQHQTKKNSCTYFIVLGHTSWLYKKTEKPEQQIRRVIWTIGKTCLLWTGGQGIWSDWYK